MSGPEIEIEIGSPLPYEDSVYRRVLYRELRVKKLKQITPDCLDNNLHQTNYYSVPAKVFHGRRKLDDGTFERGISVDWSQKSTPKENQKRHNNPKYEDHNFGVISLSVSGLNKIKYNSDKICTEYDPKEDNSAHSLIIGIPTCEYQNNNPESFNDLRNDLSINSCWKIIPIE